MIFNRLKKNGDFPRYYRHSGGVYAKVISPRKWIKSSYTKDGHRLDECLFQHSTEAEIFSNWKQIDSKQYEKHIEEVTAPAGLSQEQRPIEFAFEVGGKKYYRYKDLSQMPIGRHAEAEIVLMEFELRADRDTVRKAFLDILNHCTGQEINAGKIAAIASNMVQRVDLLIDFTLLEKYASIVYFEETEDTSAYNPTEAKAKIDHWRNFGGLDFFLKMPAVKFLLPDDSLKAVSDQTLKQMEALKRALNAQLEQLSKNT